MRLRRWPGVTRITRIAVAALPDRVFRNSSSAPHARVGPRGNRFAVTIPGMADIEYQSSGDRRHERGPVLRKLFGPSRDEIWNLLAQQIGGELKQREGWTGRSRVDAQ